MALFVDVHQLAATVSSIPQDVSYNDLERAVRALGGAIEKR
jgi:hypothetical protein